MFGNKGIICGLFFFLLTFEEALCLAVGTGKEEWMESARHPLKRHGTFYFPHFKSRQQRKHEMVD